MSRAGYTSLAPSKGNHFPLSPFVEYLGTVDAAEREPFKERVQAEVDKLVAAALPVRAAVVPYAEVGALCGGPVPGVCRCA